MKKLLVSCDEYAYYFKDQYYLREFGHILVNRYLQVYDKVKFAVRTKTVFSEKELNNFNLPVKDERIELFPIPFFQGPKEYSVNFFKIRKIIKNVADECDSAILRIPSTIGFSCLKIIKEKSIPYAVEVVANPKIMIKETKNIFLRFLMIIMHKQQINACKNADGVSYVTKYTLQKIYPNKRNGSFVSSYSSVELPHIFFTSPRNYFNKSPFIICHVANPIKTYKKGHLTVINVVKLLNKKGYNVIAQFAGEGAFIERFKKYAAALSVAHKIKFVGLLNQKQLKKFLCNSDLMLFPSTFAEGLPRVLIEAMATGMPCISSSVGGIPELIQNDYLFKPKNKEEIADVISKIIDNPQMYKKLSIYSFEKAKEFSKDILQKRRFEFYNQLKNR